MQATAFQVLLIEDNPADADLTRLHLLENDSHIEISWSQRLSEALVELSLSRPALILLDLTLPDSQGEETLRTILREARGIPVVVLSCYDDEEFATEAVKQGVQDYLVKGAYDGHRLARTIRHAVERQTLVTSLDNKRQEQLKIKDEFLSHVSHELRTPLASIHQFVTILLDGLAGDLSDDQKDHLKTILHGVNQLSSMIADLLEATRAESGKLIINARCIPIGEVVDRAVGMMQPASREKQIALECKMEGSLPLVRADASRVMQILTNLMENAIKFTPPGGSIVVRAGLRASDSEFVYLSVSDNGAGISPEAKPLIFDRLYQDPNAEHESRKGLGLGLYIVKEIVHLHHGRIWVENQEQKGSTFTFTLPVFSVSKLLLPVIFPLTRAPGPIRLITVRATTLSPDIHVWEEVRERFAEMLRSSLYYENDLLLPAVGDAEQSEVFAIVASTDQNGTAVMMKRISAKIESLTEMTDAAKFELAAVALKIPKAGEFSTAHKSAEKVADEIQQIVLAKLALSNAASVAQQ